MQKVVTLFFPESQRHKKSWEWTSYPQVPPPLFISWHWRHLVVTGISKSTLIPNSGNCKQYWHAIFPFFHQSHLIIYQLSSISKKKKITIYFLKFWASSWHRYSTQLTIIYHSHTKKDIRHKIKIEEELLLANIL